MAYTAKIYLLFTEETRLREVDQALDEFFEANRDILQKGKVALGGDRSATFSEGEVVTDEGEETT